MKNVYQHSGIYLLINECKVYICGRLVQPTRTELYILKLLFQQPGRVRTRSELQKQLREPHTNEQRVDAHVKMLRRKLFPKNHALAKIVIRSERNLGYYLPAIDELHDLLDTLIQTTSEVRGAL